MGGSLFSEGLLLSGFIRDHNFLRRSHGVTTFFLGGGGGVTLS